MSGLYSIAIALFLAGIGGQIAKKLGYPRVIGQLCISLFAGIPLLKPGLSTEQSFEIIRTMSELGVVLLLFLTGFDLDLSKVKTIGKDAFFIAIFAAVTPFVIGMGIGLAMGLGIVASVILGSCLALTAEGTKVALLLELKKVRTRVGSIMLGAGIIDDLFEIIFLSTVLIFSHKGSTDALLLLPVKIGVFVGAILLASTLLPRFIHRLERERDTTGLLTFMLIIALLFAIGSELAGLGSILGAFLGGIFMQRSFLTSEDHDGEDHMLQALAFSLIIPFFFFHIGMNFDFTVLIKHPALTLLILTAAIAGKLGGTLLTKPFVSLDLRQLTLVGWGMNSRGVMELVIAQIAYTNHLISKEIYSVIVFMAIATTVLFPLVLQHMIRRTPNIMD